MNVIYKYELKSNLYEGVAMHVNARILSAAVIGKRVYIWALVDTDSELEARYFQYFATGESIDSSIVHELNFICTVIYENGKEILHVFERVNLS